MIRNLRERLDRGEVTSVDLTKKHLDAVGQKNPALNAFISLTEDLALAQAKEADARIRSKTNVGPLTGIPLALKDNINCLGSRTTGGGLFLKDYVSPYTATVAQRLIDAGAVVLGKTNCDELAMGSSNENSAYGPVHNPWKHGYAPGGSSGGSAASVSARLVAGALGSDTGGSIRQPAAFCGIVGLKPTYGRISRYGVVSFASSLDQVGPMATTVEDAAWIYEAIAGHDPRDSTSVKRPVEPVTPTLRQKSDLKGVRIGVPKEFLPKNLSPEILENVRASMATFEKLGATLVDISLPHTEYGIACYYILAPAEASSNLARYDGIRYTRRSGRATDVDDVFAKSRSEGFGPEVRRRILLGTFVLSSGYYDAYYVKAQKVRNLIRKDYMDAFQSVDLVLTPTTPSPAFPLGSKQENPVEMYFSDAFTVPVPIAGLPALSVPSGFSTEGLPMGVQLIGRPFDEKGILEAAYVFEQQTRHFEKVPTP